MGSPEKLRVTIIGGGLSGLVTARVLREHHTVTVLERSIGNHEVGAGLGIGATAISVIEPLGFDKKRAKILSNYHSRTMDKQGNLLGEHDFRELNGQKQELGDYWLVHRVDVWQEFFRLATAKSEDLGIGGEPAKVIFDADVVDLDVESGDVKLGDGTTVESDLVVGADGITSFCRPFVTQQSDSQLARPAGTSAFRFLLPADELEKIQPGIDVLDQNRPNTIDMYLSGDGTARSIVLYPVRNYEVVNVACIVADEMVPRETTASWHAEGTTEDLMRCFEDHGSAVKKLLANASNVKLWQLRDHDPLPTYVRGRTILIGDSAHAMTPHQAQGCTQSIEDAEAFDLFNDPSATRASVPDILKLIDSVRRPRASTIQMNSRNAQYRRTADEVFKHTKYNRTYPGVRECLRRLERGETMIPV